jgi:hypothetical protein
MTSLRQLEANRQNARRSTGPRTDEGKQIARRNALRHGLTAETVIESLEDREDYKAFEATIIADYDARTAVERELVLRLASLLWRIRRATGIETDLLRIQAEILRERQQAADQTSGAEPPPTNPIYRVLRAAIPPRLRQRFENGDDEDARDTGEKAPDDIDLADANSVDPSRALTYCFLRLANLDNGAFRRLNRYETALWRQAMQTMFILRTIWHR